MASSGAAVALPANAQVNARIERDLKERGDAALAAAGITPTQAVRSLWELAANNAKNPRKITDALFPQQAKDAAREMTSARVRKKELAQKGPQLFEHACGQLGIDLRDGVCEASGASLAELKEAACWERYGNWMVG